MEALQESGTEPPQIRERIEGSKPLSSRADRGRVLHIILVTDALQYGDGWDFECSPPRDTAQFRQSVRDRTILTEESLADATVVFAWVRLDGIDRGRCPVEIETARLVRRLWASLLTSTGAARVTFEMGAPDLDALH